ncbi:hypothetical protein PR048_012546 [Dryococelus australis]|uniref:Uncharacterized protein n=1 Tax=Dryococelus australis TaxID=614101 RepID=A0ABQ9HPP7_9NEOP|nr:hypothetical protein PR048_012546 [Dryococelus australis]
MRLAWFTFPMRIQPNTVTKAICMSGVGANLRPVTKYGSESVPINKSTGPGDMNVGSTSLSPSGAEMKGWGNGRSLRKPADQRHRPA